jgi:hypothetical protein
MAHPSQLARALTLIPRAAALVARHGRPPAVLYFGGSPGDDLLATAVLLQWRQARGSRAWYLTRHPALFDGNPDVGLTLDYSPPLAGALSLLGTRRIRLKYHDYDPRDDRSRAPAGHIINLMCASAGLPPLEDPAPVLTLSPLEIAAHDLPAPYVAVQSSVRSAAMPIANKEWPPERMQEVVTRLHGRIAVVQLGSATDPPLEGARDLRGKTTLRQAAAILSMASAFIGMVGFLMHAARAVGTPSVIVFGGREHPTQSGYPGNENLFTAMECSPCWLWNRCPFDRECLARITPAQVVEAVDRVLARIVHYSHFGHDAGEDPHRTSG